MPLAQAFLDCEENEDTGELRNCKGHIEICGPMSDTYQIVLSSAHSSKYSISVSARSQRNCLTYIREWVTKEADTNAAE